MEVLVLKVPWETLVFRALVVFLARTVHLVHKGALDSLGSKVNREMLEFLDLRESLDPKESLVHQDPKECLAHREKKGNEDNEETLGLSVPLDLLGKEELQETEDFLAKMGYRVPRVHKVIVEQVDHQALKAPLEIQEEQASQVYQAQGA